MNSHNDNAPLISIITVSYNSSSTIEETILSIINQTYSNIEYIIIDGGSTDGTIDIIKKYNDKITYWISEPDKGIYDAMNKGIKKAKGEWINFMNCGDSFYSETTIKDVFNIANEDSDIIYGNTNLLYEFGNFIRTASLPTAENYMPFYHQSSFSRKEIMQERLFDIKYKICADKNFFYSIFHCGNSFEYVNLIIANYEAENGLSSINKIKFKQEIGLIEQKTSSLNWQINFAIFKLITYMKNLIKNILPSKLVTNIKRNRIKKYITHKQ